MHKSRAQSELSSVLSEAVYGTKQASCRIQTLAFTQLARFTHQHISFQSTETWLCKRSVTATQPSRRLFCRVRAALEELLKPAWKLCLGHQCSPAVSNDQGKAYTALICGLGMLDSALAT